MFIKPAIGGQFHNAYATHCREHKIGPQFQQLDLFRVRHLASRVKQSLFPSETQLTQIEFLDENVDHSNGIVLGYVIFQAESSKLSSVRSSDRANRLIQASPRWPCSEDSKSAHRYHAREARPRVLTQAAPFLGLQF
jgi:hypothetical protein